MNKLKILILQASFISLGIILAVGIVQLITGLMGNSYATEWYFNISVIFTGALCSLPTVILYLEKIKPFFIRILIHFTLVFSAVSLLGWLFRWYGNLLEYLIVILIFIFVYIFVWIITKWFYVKEDQKINDALDSIRDEE